MKENLKARYLNLPETHRWLVGFFVVLLLFTFGISLGVIFKIISLPALPGLVSRQTPAQENPMPTPAPVKPKLSLQAKTNQLTTGQTTTVAILLDTADYSIEGLDLVLAFDSELLSLVNLQKGSLFKTFPLEEVKDGLVKLSALSGLVNGKPYSLKGQGEYALLTFKAENPGAAVVEISPKSIIAAKGENVLGKIDKLELTIQ